MVRIRLLVVILTVALVTSMGAGTAQAASYSSLVQPAASKVVADPPGATASGSALAPCTAPLFGPDKDCESTSPTVDRWVQLYSGDGACTYTLFVDWGDGTSSSRTLAHPLPAVYLIASHRYGAESQTTTYTETVTSSVDSGTCNPVPTTIFKFTHLKSAVAPWQNEMPISKACLASLLLDIGASSAELLTLAGVFTITGQAELDAALFFVGGAYLVYEFVHTCVEQNTALSVLPHAFAYGVSHPGKRFRPSRPVPQTPQITGIYGYQKGSLVYFSLSYADPGHDAKGFGFVGIKGAGWAQENHPFSNPSYGIVGNHRIDYPFNLGCGTAQEYKSYVEAWIYDSQGKRSKPVEVDLTCTT
jgi:hypothetical protein